MQIKHGVTTIKMSWQELEDLLKDSLCLDDGFEMRTFKHEEGCDEFEMTFSV